MLLSFCRHFSEQSIAAKFLLLPELIGNSKQIFYGIDQSTWMLVSSSFHPQIILSYCFYIFPSLLLKFSQLSEGHFPE